MFLIKAVDVDQSYGARFSILQDNGVQDIEKENSSSEVSEEEESEENNFGAAAALSVPLAASQFVTRRATGIFSRGQRNVDPIHLQSKRESELPSEESTKASEAIEVSDESSSQKATIVDSDDSENKNEKGEENVSTEPSETLCGLRTEDSPGSFDNDFTFKRFDITRDPTGHYFIGANGQTNSRKWFKKVQQDWSILQNNLPDGIYVRVYEDRMDLLRAVIVGAFGTPYQDGLFSLIFTFHQSTLMFHRQQTIILVVFKSTLIYTRKGRTILYLMRRGDPPKDFEVIVKDASVSDKTNQNSTSLGFKLGLAKIMPKLFLALSEVEADYHGYPSKIRASSLSEKKKLETETNEHNVSFEAVSTEKHIQDVMDSEDDWYACIGGSPVNIIFWLCIFTCLAAIQALILGMIFTSQQCWLLPVAVDVDQSYGARFSILQDNGVQDIEKENSSSEVSEEEESEENNFGAAAALSVPLAASQFVTRRATGIFSRGQRNVDPIHLQSKRESELPSEESTKASEAIEVSDESSSQKATIVDSDDSENKNEKGEENVSTEPSETLCGLRTEDSPGSFDNDFTFKRFDITRDPTGHYFIGANGQTNSRKWFKKVQQDWSILQNNLPDGIYVRVYEDRMDLLRAVIVGAFGTPYQDGLFFFDFHLPSKYPDVPPSANYHSGGFQINPNLYEEGKVCLSLLNTWTGKGNEVGTAEGEKNSLSYNEHTFLDNCRTILYLMRRGDPPKDFEVIVKDASVSDKTNQNSTSLGFKLGLAKIMPKLFLALSEVEADCEEFKHLKELA
ncbi:hypothetical protein K1719_005611 [Acacia pycnantha]|nr:hypothetical protein K1719_005611 [Acacia pycnantha]